MFVDEVVAAAVDDAGQLAPRVVGVGGRDRCVGGVILVTEEFYSRLAGIANLLIGQSH